MINLEEDKLLLGPENLKPSSRKFEIMGVLNPAATRLPDGRILLYVRVIERLKKTEDYRYFYVPRYTGKNKFQIKIDKFSKNRISGQDEIAIVFKNNTKRLTFISHFRRVYLDETGLKVLKIEQKPSFFGTKEDSELGVEDPRITKIGNTYCMTYVGLSRKEGISTYLATSKDAMNWKRQGIIFGEQDKDVVLFPEKIKNKYVIFDRPEGNFEFSTPHTWIAYSKDLINWGKLKAVQLAPKDKDFSRIGAGPPPIEVEKGWLQIFHAVTHTHPRGFWVKIKKMLGKNIEQSPDIYNVWAALLKKDNPEKILARSPAPIITPRRKYEISFEGKKVVFPTGIIKDKEHILLYSGVGDIQVNVKKIKLKDIINSLKNI
jgi:beta-1,2-mannobiose phosphorylase / 1,2-beta-oligomannan phosphorylase